MKRSRIGMGFALLRLTTFVLLGRAAAAADEVSLHQNLCNRLNDLTPGVHSSLTITGIGYAGDRFYILTNEHTGYEINTRYAFFNESFWLVNLANATLLKINALEKAPTAAGHSHSVIGHLPDKRRFVLINKDGSRRHHLLVDLNEPQLKETPIDLQANMKNFMYKYIYNSDQVGRFFIQKGSGLYEGTFDALIANTQLNINVNFSTPKCHISTERTMQPCTGFVHKNLLYAVNNHAKTIDMYRMERSGGGNAKSTASQPFRRVFDCTGELWKNVSIEIRDDERQNRSKAIFVIGIAVVLLLLTAVLGLLVLSRRSFKGKTQGKGSKRSIVPGPNVSSTLGLKSVGSIAGTLSLENLSSHNSSSTQKTKKQLKSSASSNLSTTFSDQPQGKLFCIGSSSPATSTPKNEFELFTLTNNEPSRGTHAKCLLIASIIVFGCAVLSRSEQVTHICHFISERQHASLHFENFSFLNRTLHIIESGREYEATLVGHHLQLHDAATETTRHLPSPVRHWGHFLHFAGDHYIVVDQEDYGTHLVVTVANLTDRNKQQVVHAEANRRQVAHRIIADEGKGYVFFEVEHKRQVLVAVVRLCDLLGDKTCPGVSTLHSADVYLNFLFNGTLLRRFLQHPSSYFVMSRRDDESSAKIFRSGHEASPKQQLFQQSPAGFMADANVYLFDTTRGVVHIVGYQAELKAELPFTDTEVPFWSFFGCDRPAGGGSNVEHRPDQLEPPPTSVPPSGPDLYLWMILALLFIFAVLMTGAIAWYFCADNKQRLENITFHGTQYPMQARERHQQKGRGRGRGHQKASATTTRQRQPSKKKRPSDTVKAWWPPKDDDTSSIKKRNIRRKKQNSVGVAMKAPSKGSEATESSSGGKMMATSGSTDTTEGLSQCVVKAKEQPKGSK